MTLSDLLWLRPSPRMAVVFENFWTGTACVQIHLLEMAELRGMGMALSKQFETTSFAVTNPCSLLSCRDVSSRVAHRALAWPFLFTALFSSFKPIRGREFAHVLLPKSVESYVVTRGGRKPSNSACHVLSQNTSKLTRRMLRCWRRSLKL